MPRVEPHAREVRPARRAAALRHLALVVREDVVLAARVEVDLVAKQHPRHRAALEVPARIPLAPRTRPTHEMRRIRLPQHEVGRMPLDRLVLRADAPTLALAQVVERVARQPAVRGKALHAEVHDAVARDIRVAARDQLLDERDHLRHAARRARHELGVVTLLDRDLEAELARVLEEPLRVELRHRVRVRGVDLRARGQLARLLRLGDAPARDRHLVLAAAVGRVVLGHVADVGDVHHVLHAHPVQLERAPQRVGVEERPEVADVRVVVDRRTAGVEGDLAIGVHRTELLERLRQRVVDTECHREPSQTGQRPSNSRARTFTAGLPR